jgi:hypothetical protein
MLELRLSRFRYGDRAMNVRIALFGLVVCAAFSAGAGESDAPDQPVAVLDRFLGEWKTEATIRALGDAPREIHTRGLGACERTLEGRYYEFRTRTIPPGEAELQIMTYDDAADAYRQWVFSSDGYRHEATGTWDAQAGTMTWRGKTDGASFVIADRFVSPERLEWTLERKDASGNVVQTIEGVLERQDD